MTKRLIAASSALALGVALLALSPAAQASSGCLTGAVTVTPTGAEQCYQVPAGVTSLTVEVIGQAGSSFGGPSYFGAGVGGQGADVTASLNVSALSLTNRTLYLEVGSGGVGGVDPNSGMSGGNSSDIRTCSITATCAGDTRVVVAGGGGSSDWGNGGYGGAPGGNAGGALPASPAPTNNGVYSGSPGANGASPSTGGAGGSAIPGDAGTDNCVGTTLPPTAGVGANGGNGGADGGTCLYFGGGGSNGGGGGAGYFGGGGGGNGGGNGTCCSYGPSGGGGGSSYADPAVTSNALFGLSSAGAEIIIGGTSGTLTPTGPSGTTFSCQTELAGGTSPTWSASGPCSQTFLQGSTVKVTATAPTGAGTVMPVWTGCSTTYADGSCGVTLGASPAAPTVAFDPFHTLTVAINSVDGVAGGMVRSAVGSISCPGTCTEQVPAVAGSPGTVTLSALPDSASYLSGWTGGGCADTSTSCTLTVGANTTVTASFLTCPAGFSCAAFTGPVTSFSSICPIGGSSIGGTPVTLTGKDLLASDVVLFDGVPATVVRAAPDGSSLTVTSPPHPPGAATVTIENLPGDSATFTYGSAAPTITAASGIAVPYTGAAPVTLTGTNLFDVVKVTDTSFTAPLTGWHAACDGTSITFTPPDQTNATVSTDPIDVLTANGASNTYTLRRVFPYTQDGGQVINGLSPAYADVLPTSVANTAFSTTFSDGHGGSVDVSVPAGALPAGTLLNIYSGAAATLVGQMPSGSTVVDGYAVAWTGPDGSHPTASAPIEITVHDPAITPKTSVAAAGSTGKLAPLPLSFVVPFGVDTLALVDNTDGHIASTLKIAPLETISAADVISAGGGNVISAGGGNLTFARNFVISAGGGNVISAGGGNVISAGGGNIIDALGGQVICAGAGNLLSGVTAGLFSGGTLNGLVTVTGNGFQTSLLSHDPELVTYTRPPVPAAPAAPTATVTANTAALRWAAPSGGRAPVTSYRVDAYDGATLVDSYVTADASTSLSVPGLQAGHTYTFTVAAFNGGYGPASPASNPVTVAVARSARGTPATPRLDGRDRVGTALLISQHRYPAARSAGAVVLASAAGFADAMVAAPLAAHLHGPLLLSPPDQLPTRVLTEITRVLAPGGTVELVGGIDALGGSIVATLTAHGFAVHRVAGRSRYDTAVAVAGALGDPTVVVEATGLRFPDALAAADVATHLHGAVLLTDGVAQAPATAGYLAAHPADTRYALGGPAATTDPGATGLVGADRFATSALVAARFFASPQTVEVLTGPDAAAAVADEPVLLVRAGSVPGGGSGSASGAASGATPTGPGLSYLHTVAATLREEDLIGAP